MRKLNQVSNGTTGRGVSKRQWEKAKIFYSSERVSIGSMDIMASSLDAAGGEFLIWTMVARALNNQLGKHASIGSCIEDVAMDVYSDVKQAVLDHGGLLAERWLQVVARNTASAIVANLFCKTRKSGSATAELRGIVSLDAEDDNGEPAVPEPEDKGTQDTRRVVQAREELDIVRQAMLRLPDRQRICMQQVAKGISVAETARALDMDPSYVRRLVTEARDALRSALESTPTSGHSGKRVDI